MLHSWSLIALLGASSGIGIAEARPTTSSRPNACAFRVFVREPGPSKSARCRPGRNGAVHLRRRSHGRGYSATNGDARRLQRAVRQWLCGSNKVLSAGFQLILVARHEGYDGDVLLDDYLLLSILVFHH